MKTKQRKRRWPRWLLIASLAAFLAVTLDYFAYPYGSELGGRSFNRGENGLWLRYTWYFGNYTPSQAAELIARLRHEQIRYAYFHVRFIRKDGSLKFHYPKSASLTEAVRNAGIKPIAWIYVDGSVQLGNLEVRKRMVEEARWLVETCGFEGVQWDVEPCPDGSQSFLWLLEDTKKAMPHAFVSVAAPTWFPWPISKQGWSEGYFAEVGKRCDQIAIMCYDTAFVLPRSYAWLVEQQAERIPTATKCQVLLGLATYLDGGRSHNPRAENLWMGLHAARESSGKFAGIALFADYTTDAAEWRLYDRGWLGQ